MSSSTEKQVEGYSWWERKHHQKGSTYENPALNQVFGNPQTPAYEFATETGAPAVNSYPANYFRTKDPWGWNQYESDMPETRILADTNRAGISEVGIMCPYVGTEPTGFVDSRK